MKLKPSLAIDGLAGNERFVAGLTYGADSALYVINTQNDTVYRLSGAEFKSQVSTKVGYRPYAAALAPNGRQLAVSNWGDESVSLLDAATLKETAKLRSEAIRERSGVQQGRTFVRGQCRVEQHHA